MTEREIDDYIAGPEFARIVTSAEFHERDVEIERRVDAGEIISLGQRAKMLGLPWPVFRRIYGGHLAWEAIKQKMGTPH
jgi:hypothetical protein